jgi:DNA repair protein RecN (Recombination protein N)
MLKKLKIKQFAIIDDIELDFYQGMTVLTGETGAGKSILIDAISLLLGERADNQMIRSKSEEAIVEGVFEVVHPMLKQLLDYHDIEYQKDITIQRKLSRDNQNVIKINDTRVPLKLINQISTYLADIHSQFDTTQLIHPEQYIRLIDDFRKEKVEQYKTHYQILLKAYREALKLYDDLKNKKSDTLKKLDLYQFQLKEISDLSLVKDELDELTEKVNVLNNIDQINYNLAESNAILNDQGILENIYHIKENLDALSRTSKDFKELSERINTVYYELEDINDEVENHREHLDYDPQELESMNERIHDLEKIQNKYQKSITELIEYQHQLEQMIEEIENYDDLIMERETAVIEAHQKLVEQANQLSLLRQTIAEKVSQEVIDTLKELEIKHADFKVTFETIDTSDAFQPQVFKENGIDQLDFLISTNKGEPLKSLAKTASGGEMSRVMLTFKTIFAKSQKVPTIIFDEIDTGISGFIAKKIGRKISETSKIAQVIAITHIPQVVAEGTHHLAIKKDIVDDYTKISVGYLSYEERIEEIASMMSAESISESAREMARQLLIHN